LPTTDTDVIPAGYPVYNTPTQSTGSLVNETPANWLSNLTSCYLSYGGVCLPVPTPEADAWVRANLSVDDLWEFRDRDRGYKTLDLPVPRHRPRRDVRLGRLYWPVGATSFAYAHFLVTSAHLSLLYPLAYPDPTTNSSTAVPLKLHMTTDGEDVLETDMWMLPPRPLAVVGADNGLHLLTLVDDRWWWRYRHTSLTYPVETGSWDLLFESLRDALRIPAADFSYSSVSTDYTGVPVPDRFYRLNAPAADVLDAACYTVGRRVVRRYDGSVVLETPSESRETTDAGYVAYYQRRSSGDFLADDPTDSPAGKQLLYTLPGSVRVVFSRCFTDNRRPDPFTSAERDNFYAVDTAMGVAVRTTEDASVDLGQTDSIKVFHPDVCATYGSDTVPTNATALSTYATKWATDWYDWMRLADTDATYAGVVATDWGPGGLTDVEVVYRTDDCRTRFSKPPIDDPTDGEPSYTPRVEFVRVHAYQSGSGSGSGLRDAVRQEYDPATGAWVDREDCYFVDANG
jgi:hypothetical protein